MWCSMVRMCDGTFHFPSQRIVRNSQKGARSMGPRTERPIPISHHIPRLCTAYQTTIYRWDMGIWAVGYGIQTISHSPYPTAHIPISRLIPRLYTAYQTPVYSISNDCIQLIFKVYVSSYPTAHIDQIPLPISHGPYPHIPA